MDFSFTEVQDDLRGLARTILEGRVTAERLKELEAGTERVDRDTWAELAKADLIGIALPESVGGGGCGVMERGGVRGEIGRCVAPVPMRATALAGVRVANFAGAELSARLLPPVIAGES